jgi:hypothetical protein
VSNIVKPPDPQPLFDNGHVSGHFVEGKFDVPLTQKIRVDDKSIRVDTKVDKSGNVMDSIFRK